MEWNWRCWEVRWYSTHQALHWFKIYWFYIAKYHHFFTWDQRYIFRLLEWWLHVRYQLENLHFRWQTSILTTQLKIYQWRNSNNIENWFYRHGWMGNLIWWKPTLFWFIPNVDSRYRQHTTQCIVWLCTVKNSDICWSELIMEHTFTRTA